MSRYKFKTTNIKGKEYVEVNERIKYFRTSEDYKGWSINTELIHFDSDSCVMKAEIRDDQWVLRATGFAQEDKSSSYINKTSYVENCETSAWGRALANLGIGIDTSIASSNEVSIAIAKQNTKESKAAAPAKKPAEVAKKQLTDDVIEKMKAAVKDGKKAAVEKALANYEVNEEQKKSILA